MSKSVNLNICRCCLSVDETVTESVFDDRIDTNVLHIHMLKYVFADEKENENEPYLLCEICSNKLIVINDFKVETSTSRYNRIVSQDEMRKMNNVCKYCFLERSLINEKKDENVFEMDSILNKLKSCFFNIFEIASSSEYEGCYSMCIICFESLKIVRDFKDKITYSNSIMKHLSIVKNVCNETSLPIAPSNMCKENKLDLNRKATVKLVRLEDTNVCPKLKLESTIDIEDNYPYNANGSSNIKKEENLPSSDNDGETGISIERNSHQVSSSSSAQKKKRSNMQVEFSQDKNAEYGRCQYCDKLIKATFMKIHIRYHRRAHCFKCQYCDKYFLLKEKLDNHEKGHKKITAENPFQCNICKATFGSRSIVDKHTASVHTEETNKVPYKNLEAASLKEKQSLSGKRYRCLQCNYGCNAKGDMKKHDVVHSAEKPFPCKKCDRRFSRKHILEMHELESHGEKKPFECKYCRRLCKGDIDLAEHELVHEREKPFTCQYCNKRFKHKSSVKIHVKIHTVDKQFKCRYCDKRFRFSSYLNYHELTHTGNKPYGCQHCGKRFIKNSELKYHEVKHTENKAFQCDICSTRFTFKSGYTLHMKSRHYDEYLQAKRLNGEAA